MSLFSTTRGKVFAGILTAGVALALVPAMHVLATWGPDRPTFTWAHPASYITFNSITDNPSVGDERKFFGVADANATQYHNDLTVHDNQELSMRVYFHNNAASNLNLVATNTRIQVKLPTNTNSTTQSAAAYIIADNAKPVAVADTVNINGANPFTLTYEPGTAQLWNNVFRGQHLSDGIVGSNGALIGYNAIDGKVPGCSEFSGWVTIKVRVHMQTPPVEHKFACSALDVVNVDRTRFDFTAHATTQNANVQSYVFTTENSGGNTVDTTTVNSNALSAVYHFNQSTPGTYTVSVVVHTDQGNTERSAVCTKQVTVKSPPKETPPPHKPTKPVVKGAKTLPNTGPGEIAGLFAGASSLGAAAHYASRKFRK